MGISEKKPKIYYGLINPDQDNPNNLTFTCCDRVPFFNLPNHLISDQPILNSDFSR